MVDYMTFNLTPEGYLQLTVDPTKLPPHGGKWMITFNVEHELEKLGGSSPNYKPKGRKPRDEHQG